MGHLVTAAVVSDSMGAVYRGVYVAAAIPVHVARGVVHPAEGHARRAAAEVRRQGSGGAAAGSVVLCDDDALPCYDFRVGRRCGCSLRAVASRKIRRALSGHFLSNRAVSCCSRKFFCPACCLLVWPDAAVT